MILFLEMQKKNPTKQTVMKHFVIYCIKQIFTKMKILII